MICIKWCCCFCVITLWIEDPLYCIARRFFRWTWPKINKNSNSIHPTYKNRTMWNWWQWWPLPGASWRSQSELQWPNECHHLPVNKDRYHYATEDWEIVSEALGESFLWSSQNCINRPFHRREAHHAGIWRLLRRRIVSVIPILYAICCCMFCHPANE